MLSNGNYMSNIEKYIKIENNFIHTDRKHIQTLVKKNDSINNYSENNCDCDRKLNILIGMLFYMNFNRICSAFICIHQIQLLNILEENYKMQLYRKEFREILLDNIEYDIHFYEEIIKFACDDTSLIVKALINLSKNITTIEEVYKVIEIIRRYIKDKEIENILNEDIKAIPLIILTIYIEKLDYLKKKITQKHLDELHMFLNKSSRYDILPLEEIADIVSYVFK